MNTLRKRILTGRGDTGWGIDVGANTAIDTGTVTVFNKSGSRVEMPRKSFERIAIWFLCRQRVRNPKLELPALLR